MKLPESFDRAMRDLRRAQIPGLCRKRCILSCAVVPAAADAAAGSAAIHGFPPRGPAGAALAHHAG